MIIGLAYPYPPYSINRKERSFSVLGKPHQHYMLNACKNIVDKMYVLSALPEVVEIANDLNYITMPYSLVDKAEGLLPGHQMTNAMMDFIKDDLDIDYEALMQNHILTVNTDNALVRPETLDSMVRKSKELKVPNIYLAMRLNRPIGIQGSNMGIVNVLNDAPLEIDEHHRPRIYSFEQSTSICCDRNTTPGRPRHYVHEITELEGVLVDSRQKAKLAAFVLEELPDYHVI